MRFWKAFIKVTLGTVMPREEARLYPPAPARVKREEPVADKIIIDTNSRKPETMTAAAPERVMRDIIVPERFEEPKTEIPVAAVDQVFEAKPKRVPAKKRLKKTEEAAPEDN